MRSAGAHGALGVVLVRDGRPEDGHDRVSDELLDRAPVALDLLPQAGMVGPDARADVFRVSRFRCSGEADEIAEEHRHDLALLSERRRRLLAQRCSAERAEGELARKFLAAGGTGRHQPSLVAKCGVNASEAAPTHPLQIRRERRDSNPRPPA